MKTHLAAATVLLVVLSAIAVPAHASIVSAGDDIKLYDGLGSAGGIFNVDVAPSGPPSFDFQTFCVQTTEFISFSPTYRVLSVGKSVLGSDLAHQDGAKLGSFAAWLYSGFLGVDGVTLSGFNVLDILDVNAIQVGIWRSMGYLPGGDHTSPIGAITNFDSALLGTAVAPTAGSLTYQWLNDAAWQSKPTDVNGLITGNVKIMNLVTLGAQGQITNHHQDQLFYDPPPPGGGAPVPEPMSLFVWSLLASCVGVAIGRRRAA